MTQARPPGWYDEPGGDRASLRWWDGRAWTPVTRERAPSERPAPLVATDVLDSGPPPGAPAPRRTLLLAGVAVVALLGLVVALLPRGDDSRDTAGQPPASAPVFPSEPAPTTATPVSGRIEDRVARLSYDVLPGEWREWDRESFDGLRSTLGYYRVTQENAPGNQTYWANVNSGPVDDRTVGPDLPGTALRLATTLAGSYYPDHQRTQVQQRTLTVDGAPAALVRYTAVFDREAAAGYSAQTEQIVILVVDVGQPQPSALYISLPDTVRPLWSSIDPLLAGVRVIR
jgi:hypothetical protein